MKHKGREGSRSKPKKRIPLRTFASFAVNILSGFGLDLPQPDMQFFQLRFGDCVRRLRH